VLLWQRNEFADADGFGHNGATSKNGTKIWIQIM